jgi:hypothetical protein
MMNRGALFAAFTTLSCFHSPSFINGQPPPTPTCPTPATSLTTITVEAECYQWMQGVKIEDTSNVGSGKNDSYIDTGDWMAYPEVTI